MDARCEVMSPDPGASGIGGSKPHIIAPTNPDGPEAKPKIQQFAQALGAKNREDIWKRKPNVNGTGATHVKSFHCKLAEDSLAFMDQQINNWLDEHPEIEVKFVTSSIGDWQGKIKEPGLIVNVWI